MALITRTIISCNKCGAEAQGDYAAQIVQALGDEYYLCDDCMLRLLNWLSVPVDTAPVRPSNVDSGARVKPYSYTKWDEDRLQKLFDLRASGETWTSCAQALAVSKSAIYSVLDRIKNAKPGYDLHKWQKYLDASEGGE